MGETLKVLIVPMSYSASPINGEGNVTVGNLRQWQEVFISSTGSYVCKGKSCPQDFLFHSQTSKEAREKVGGKSGHSMRAGEGCRAP